MPGRTVQYQVIWRVLLLLLLIAVAGAGTLHRCIGADGHAGVELAHPGEVCHDDGLSLGGTQLVADAECVDTPVAVDLFRSEHDGADALAPPPVLLTAVLPAAPTRVAVPPVARPHGQSPPDAGHPLHRVILLV